MDAVRLGIPDSVVLTKEEEAELDSSMAYQHKIREQASPRSAASPAVKRGKVFLGDGGPPRQAPPPGPAMPPGAEPFMEPPHDPPGPLPTGVEDPDKYSAGLTTQELSAELCSERAIALLADGEFLPGHRPSHLGLHSAGLTIFKEVGKRRRGRTEERWASSGGRKGARDMIFAPVIAANGGPFLRPAKEMLDAPQWFADTNSTNPQVVKAARVKLAKLGPIIPAPTEMAIGNMDTVLGFKKKRGRKGRPPLQPQQVEPEEGDERTDDDDDDDEEEDDDDDDEDEEEEPEEPEEPEPAAGVAQRSHPPAEEKAPPASAVTSEPKRAPPPPERFDRGYIAAPPKALAAENRNPIVVGVRRRCAAIPPFAHGSSRLSSYLVPCLFLCLSWTMPSSCSLRTCLLPASSISFIFF